MHVHVGRKKRHAVQPSVRCCLPANGTSPKYSSTLSVDMLLSDRDTLDNEPLDASKDPAVGNCSKSSSVSVSMSRDLRLYTYWWQISAIWEISAILRLKLPTVLRKYCEKGYHAPISEQWISAIDHIVSIMLNLWQLCFTICPRPLLLCAYHRYREIVNIRILYTDIYSRYKYSPPWVASHRVSKAHEKWSQSYRDENLLKRNVRARRHARNMPCKSKGK